MAIVECSLGGRHHLIRRPGVAEHCAMPLKCRHFKTLFICYKQSPDNVYSVASSQRSSTPCLTEDENFNDSDIINILINYEDEQEEPDSLRADKNMQGSSFPPNWKSVFLK
ncbi:uncharacterized protein TNCV_5099631 [Trichonephila clavipes]|uniref:Uncharacterized protein n=1 Tax=Trichonephila clavipes TaxID=2585209 RepID=A0A8X6RUL4_TRICX|nr:uncharacterized protein TNCV_5099631 [Trichonephila clavipes]